MESMMAPTVMMLLEAGIRGGDPLWGLWAPGGSNFYKCFPWGPQVPRESLAPRRIMLTIASIIRILPVS